MVEHSTNNNKAIYQLSCQTLEQTKPRYVLMEIRVIAWDRQANCGQIKPVNRINIFDFKRQHKYKQTIKNIHEIDSNQIDHTQ